MPPGRHCKGADGRECIYDENDLLAAFKKRGRIKIDFEHASQLKGARGEHVPAAGWIVDLDVSDVENHGVRGKSQWTPRGEEAWVNGDYRSFSPALFQEKKSKKVLDILTVGLVSVPNFPELTLNSLSQETSQSMEEKNFEKVLSLFGLEAESTITEVEARVEELKARSTRLDQLEATIATVTEELKATKSELEKLRNEKASKEEEEVQSVVEEALNSMKIMKYERESAVEQCRKIGPAEYRKLVSRMAPIVEGKIETHALGAAAKKTETQLSDVEKGLAQLFGFTPDDVQKFLTKDKG